jgi:hypothetical protein
MSSQRRIFHMSEYIRAAALPDTGHPICYLAAEGVHVGSVLAPHIHALLRAVRRFSVESVMPGQCQADR